MISWSFRQCWSHLANMSECLAFDYFDSVFFGCRHSPFRSGFLEIWRSAFPTPNQHRDCRCCSPWCRRRRKGWRCGAVWYLILYDFIWFDHSSFIQPCRTSGNGECPAAGFHGHWLGPRLRWSCNSIQLREDCSLSGILLLMVNNSLDQFRRIWWIHPWKLTWHWKIPIFNRKYIFIPGGFSSVMLVFGSVYVNCLHHLRQVEQDPLATDLCQQSGIMHVVRWLRMRLPNPRKVRRQHGLWLMALDMWKSSYFFWKNL